MIIGNKSDVEKEKREVTFEEGKKFAEDRGYHFYETSAKNNENITEAFNDMFEQLYKAFEPEITGEVKIDEKMKIKNKGRSRSRGCC